MRPPPSAPALLVLTACGASAAPGGALPATSVPQGFWDHWGDGRAELDGYRYTTRRYGELREGRAVHVWVTEDFTAGQQVKSDGGHGDEYPVLKLNDLRRFQTGLYDYQLTQSVFVPLDGRSPVGQPVKTVLSVNEWCGAMFEQLLLGPGKLAGVRHSYFDGESDPGFAEEVPTNGVLADALPYLARGLAGDPVPPGGTVEVKLRLSLVDQRLAHREAAWLPARMSRAAQTERIEVPAGEFEVRRFTVTVDDACPAAGIASDGTSCEQTWWVEEAAPRRIVRWTRDTGEEAVLVGSMREAYWKTQKEGDERLLDQLGLSTKP